ncbi:hypothetical protein [Bosea vaviloviae]|uniref:Uncharacterized protein n=1 Tax=Bosea vaviloviae TaxID=1526658 RepID=A0A1D7UC85_9HYPH|nr:hypothetical protein [Bosea vaviloviae]AOO84983.1 hypothetical protein BHK69_30150 [Bosea vaviloviae]
MIGHPIVEPPQVVFQPGEIVADIGLDDAGLFNALHAALVDIRRDRPPPLLPLRRLGVLLQGPDNCLVVLVQIREPLDDFARICSPNWSKIAAKLLNWSATLDKSAILYFCTDYCS